MKNKTSSSMLARWLRQRRGIMGYTFIVFCLFWAVYALHRLPTGVFAYAMLLALAAGIVPAVLDFARFRTQEQTLRNLLGHFPAEPLPAVHTPLDEAYVAVIAGLEAERRHIEEHNAELRRDAEEYYTLWAHQIKNPLAALQLLLQSGDCPHSAEMEQELFRMAQYVDMVLQYQRLSSLQNDLILQRFPLQCLVHAAAKNCAPLFIHKRLSFSAEKVTGSIVTDEKWFGFVLEQLLTNAVKYTHRGGVRVYVQNNTTLIIEDSGVGIPPEDVARVFERGFTGAVGRTERSSTGIGLYLCKAVLMRLGFGITIESQQGKGTKVLLHLHQICIEID